MSAEVGAVGQPASRDWTPTSIGTLAVLTLIYAFNYLDRSVLSLVLPQIQRDLELSDTALGWVTGFAFVLFYSVLGVPVARLADRVSRRNIIAIGLVFWSLMTVATGFVGKVWHLVASRFLMGAGEACGIAPSQSLVADLFSKATRPMALSILASGSSLAYVIFFPVAGWIAHHYGWRATFMAAGAPGLLLAALLLLTVREPLRTASLRPAQEGFGRSLSSLFVSRTYTLAVIGGSFMGISLYASGTWNPMFLVRVHHFDLVQVGATVGPLRGVAGLLGMLLAGYIADRMGQRDERWRMWTPGIASVIVLPLDLVFLLSDDVTVVLVALGLAQLATMMHIGPTYAACLSVVTPGMRATAAAVFLLFANFVGQIIGPLAVGYLNDSLQARYGDLAIRYSLIVGAISAAVAGVFFLFASRSLAADTRLAEATS